MYAPLLALMPQTNWLISVKPNKPHLILTGKSMVIMLTDDSAFW
jgi:hypothetical protein